ncbi:hypothetical protein SAMN05444411_101852 [Lutibacter oricola]|uniref:Uncharacterized protein n=1 Tax=Lutibacter oricola TaxID=762486 RepID=A0A1H2U042_9FLAO|nr:hypothetical protein [Lutibacter oricola]SDW49411.1 hypothetical protein SAMN05444411_101852 [Lutibacter oricola]
MKKQTSLIIGSIIILVLIVSPYLLYINQFIPEDLKTYPTIFGEISPGYFGSIKTFVYWIFAKLVPIILLSILYITNKNWWSLAILVPISVYVFQLISVINDSAENIDEIEFIYTLPLLVFVSIALFLIRRKIIIYIKAKDLKTEMEEVIEKSNRKE